VLEPHLWTLYATIEDSGFPIYVCDASAEHGWLALARAAAQALGVQLG
jgi:hypothetical protein